MVRITERVVNTYFAKLYLSQVKLKLFDFFVLVIFGININFMNFYFMSSLFLSAAWGEEGYIHGLETLGCNKCCKQM